MSTFLPALAEALDCAVTAAGAAETGDGSTAAAMLRRATVAAAGAFPPGSSESRALGAVLEAIRREAMVPA